MLSFQSWAIILWTHYCEDLMSLIGNKEKITNIA